MNRIAVKPRFSIKWLEKGDGNILRQTRQLSSTLINLRFEGKASYGKNKSQLMRMIFNLKQEILRHTELEEKKLFPFVKAHIPRLEVIIQLLSSEHRDFKEALKELEELAQWLLKENPEPTLRVQTLQIIKEKGTYLIHLLRHHVAVENKGVYQALARELRSEEKEELRDLVAGCQTCYSVKRRGGHVERQDQ